MLDPESETFIVYVASLSSIVLLSFFLLNVHCRPQIADLIAEKASIKVLVEYTNFMDGFSLDMALKLFVHTRINNYAIKDVDGNGFMRLSKSPAGARIFSHLL